jgi:predicted transcriptional regulator
MRALTGIWLLARVLCRYGGLPRRTASETAFSEDFFRKDIVGTSVSSVVFRNMSSEDVPADETRQLDLTDPKAMRALAHPVRMALLELFRSHQTLTATQASELLGESPANCAFHLRTLAKYGYVEEAGGGQGRERPWRSPTKRISVTSGQLDGQAAIAAQALGQMWLERLMERARRMFWVPAPPTWEAVRTATMTHCYVTPAELKEIADGIAAVMQRYDGRDDRQRRPEGSMPVDLLFLGYPVIDQV